MDEYITFKITTDYIVPAILIVVVVLIIIAVCCLKGRRERVLTKHFTKLGYQRKFLSTPNNYGWRRGEEVIWDKEIEDLTIKQIKARYRK